VGVDRLVLGAVVAEEAPHLRPPPDRQQVDDQQRQPQPALDQNADQARAEPGGGQADRQRRDQEEEADRQREREGQRGPYRAGGRQTGRLPGRDAGREEQRPHAQVQRIGQQGDPARERPAGDGAAPRPAAHRLDVADDAAVRRPHGHG
jgi:hypothetical protein